jgi:hypothetical protein
MNIGYPKHPTPAINDKIVENPFPKESKFGYIENFKRLSILHRIYLLVH